MSLNLAKAEELISYTLKLAAMTEQDIATLKAGRPSALAMQNNDRTIQYLLFGKAAAEFKPSGALATLPAETKQRLKAATERLHIALKEENRLLARFRHISEGLIRAIADSVAKRGAPPAYAKSGSFVKPAASRASAMTLNQAV
jgi:tRNA C32,U32 (ribose-2'-O)-methylase TrmJ